MKKRTKENVLNFVKQQCVRTVAAFMAAVLCTAAVTPAFTAEAAENTEVIATETAAPENLNTKGYDVVYVIDNSRSVWDMQEERNLAFQTITHLAVGSDIRIGAIYFADHIYKTMGLTSLNPNGSSEDEVRGRLETIEQFLNMTEEDPDNIDTNIGAALEKAVEMLNGQSESREKIVILFSDGINENLEGDSYYKENADKKTEAQAKILKDMGAAIYCVHLQQDRTDEAYLKNLVNYFSGENYATERFFAVATDEITSLSMTFSEVYFSMRNNMKYHSISLDSSGNASFYVPSMGISTLRVYMEGVEIGTQVLPPADSKGQYDPIGNAHFFSYTDPVVGEWTIKAKCNRPDKANGIISYETMIYAKAECAAEKGSGKYKVRVRFFDEDGDEIDLDENAVVAVELNCIGEDSQSIQALDMKVSNGIAQSGAFSLADYGSYQYKINLSYYDFVNLNYTLDAGFSREKEAPMVFPMTAESFTGNKTDNGIEFKIPEEKLYQDPQGEKVTVVDVVQLNSENEVSVDQRDGHIFVTAKGQGDVEFVLKLEDTSGMKTEVGIQGTVKDKNWVFVMKIISILAAIVLAAFVVIEIVKANSRKEKLAGNIQEYERQYQAYIKKKEEIQDNRKLMGDAIDSKYGFKRISTMMDGGLKEKYGVSEYLEDGYTEKKFQQFSANEKNTITLNEQMAMLKEQADYDEDEKKVKKASKKMCQKAEKILRKAEKNTKELEKIDQEITTDLDVMGDKLQKLNERLNTTVKRKLRVGYQDVFGVLVPEGWGNEKRNSVYRLDQIELDARRRLEDRTGKLDVYLFGYPFGSGEAGFYLEGRQVTVTNVRTGEWQENEAVLLKGEVYELETDSKKLKLSVI